MSITLTTSQSEMSSPRSPRHPKISLSYDGVDCELRYDLLNFVYKDFDSFVRQRFQIKEDAALKYLQNFEEVMPSPEVLRKGKVYLVDANGRAEKRAGTSHKGGTHTDNYYIYASVIMAAFAFALAPKSVTLSSASKVFDLLDSLTVSLGLPKAGVSNTEWRTLYIEAFTAFMCRAVCELVVRRGCNPENQFDAYSVLRRFSIDSVFAGLAAAIAIFVRKFALSNLR